MFNDTLLGFEFVSPNRDLLDILIFIIQIITLIFVIIYVKKTWDIASATRDSTKTSERMLKEMRDARDQETAPYVIAYFEFKNHAIYLYIKNIGKTVARDINLEFEPKLQTTLMDDYICNTNLIKNGIKSIAPGQEIKTLLDTAPRYLNSTLPMSYTVKISYCGGLLNTIRESEQILDISVQHGLIPGDENGIPEIVKEIKNLSEYNKNISGILDKIQGHLAKGVWVNNSSFMISQIPLDSAEWRSLVAYKLKEFKSLWSAIHSENLSSITDGLGKTLDMKLNIICLDLITINSNYPGDISPEIVDNMYSNIIKLCQLQWGRYVYWNRNYSEAIKMMTTEIDAIIDEMLKQIESEFVSSPSE